ncbi:MAG TPA: hypothetical protein VK203_03100 [Nostocaceae cyanobacterium]|nr:hypothetical protein [Nostocaceae cyanobacterium]
MRKQHYLGNLSAMFNPLKKTTQSDADEKEMKRKINEEFLRQVKLTFNLALGVSAASAMMTLFGVGMLYFNKVQEGGVTTGTGILASIGSVQFAKEAKEDLRKLMEELEELKIKN